MAAEFEIEVKPDGRIAVTTGDMHGPHHGSADELLRMMEQLAGGKVERKSRKGVHRHAHSHGQHVHTDGTKHSH